jgi:hypothetical protein
LSRFGSKNIIVSTPKVFVLNEMCLMVIKSSIKDHTW